MTAEQLAEDLGNLGLSQEKSSHFIEQVISNLTFYLFNITKVHVFGSPIFDNVNVAHFFLLHEQWKANMSGLSQSVLGQTLMVNQLVDMEWKFGGEFLCKNSYEVADM